MYLQTAMGQCGWSVISGAPSSLMRNKYFPALFMLQLTLVYTTLTIILRTLLYTTFYMFLYIVLYIVKYIVMYRPDYKIFFDYAFSTIPAWIVYWASYCTVYCVKKNNWFPAQKGIEKSSQCINQFIIQYIFNTSYVF